MKSRITTAILTVLFLGVMFGGLFHVSLGMDMTGDMSGCPFMSHEESLCSMGVFEHLGAWQNTFQATSPSFLLLLSAVFVVLTLAPNRKLLAKLFYRLRYRRWRIVKVLSFFHRPLQELFSNGILNPKLF